MLIVAAITSKTEATMIIEVISAEIIPITEDSIIGEAIIVDMSVEKAMISIKAETATSKMKMHPSNLFKTDITRINTIKIITTTIISIRTTETIRDKTHLDPAPIKETTRLATTEHNTETTTPGTSLKQKK
jgi:hypothetical protein